jgi:hypothetical protein
MQLTPATFTDDQGREWHAEAMRIDRTMLGWEDHGIFTFVLDLATGASHQGFGTLCLSDYDKTQKRQVGTAFGLDILMHILNVVGVSEWENLNGKRVYALREERSGWIKGIANIDDPSRYLIADDIRKQWFPDC